MNVHLLLHGQRFVWDERKAATNLAKHGIRFDEACEVFFDPFLKLVDAGSTSEAREAAMGVLEADVIRLISARQVSTQERRLYENHD